MTASVEIFEFCHRVAVVANLHRRPPLVAAILEVIGDRPGQVGADHLPGDVHPPLGQVGDQGESLPAQVEVTGIAFGAQIDDAHGDLALGTDHMHVSPAGGGVIILYGVHG